MEIKLSWFRILLFVFCMFIYCKYIIKKLKKEYWAGDWGSIELLDGWNVDGKQAHLDLFCAMTSVGKIIYFFPVVVMCMEYVAMETAVLGVFSVMQGKKKAGKEVKIYSGGGVFFVGFV